MKRVMAQYAGAVVAASVAIALFHIFCGSYFADDKSLSVLIGQTLENEFEENQFIDTGDTFDKIKNKTKPVLTQKNYAFVQNNVILISDVVNAVDRKGKTLDVKVTNIWGADFEVTEGILTKGERKLELKKHGIYWLKVQATDEDLHTSSGLIRIFVNER